MDAVEFKRLRKRWHRANNAKAEWLAHGHCQLCGKETHGTNGAILHHRSYPRGCYERQVSELMAEGVCLWIYHRCHIEEHLAANQDEGQHSMKQGGYCSECSRHCFGGWRRARKVGHPGCLCKPCYRLVSSVAGSTAVEGAIEGGSLGAPPAGA